MREKIQSLLKELWAKDDGTTIREHTDKLLENLQKLRDYYRKEIEELIPKGLPTELKERFWEILELACEYHDYGKIHCKFQEKIGNKNIKPIKGLPEVRHNLLSPVFVNVEDELIRKIVRLLVLHHHPVEVEEMPVESVERVLREEFKFEKNPISFMLKKREEDYLREDVAKMFKIPVDELILYYRLLKGLLLRIDHASSSKHAQEVEDEPPGDTLSFVDDFFKKQGRTPYEMQIFVRENRDKNLVIIAPTGAGKTEAGFIYLQRKGFFMLPYRVSANGIYMRAEGIFRNEGNRNNRNYAGLLHSSALSYVLEREENREDIQNNQEGTAFLNYFLSRNFAKPIIVSTPDQLMHFVFRYKGFEKYYATALYSRLVIDELQSYDPITLAFIVQGLEVLAQNGGKFLVMTATFPEFLRERFERMGVEFKTFNTQEKPYHNVQVIDDSIDNYVDKMIELSQKAKVLAVVNTVRKAIELREKLKDKLPHVKLLHSRFILKDRKEKEIEIMKFFNSQENGLWITTQLAEVSLDLDADYLFTELSTADSLIQRMGRCNRKGQKSTDEPNVFIFTKDCSGVGPVYYKHLHESTLKNLKDGLWDWDFKWELVEKVYSESALYGTKYWERFKKAESYIKSLWEGADSLIRSKSEAQDLFRDINAVQVIPNQFKEDVESLIQEWEKAKGDFIKRTKLLSDILEYSFSLPAWSIREIEKQKIHDRLGIYYIEGDYSEDTGFVLKPTADTEQVENII
ncbi:CRISPR-associated helicase Cas3' [Thermocrinis sp.]|jgi:CRISPR-associated endonuclease/helicase Cas3|uniref:CRISPR-associated helicase Cas3' n=1 Tax=Thermocrinis sp. TaxID=2024383 RepID=UPI002636BE53|nr:CRISPR-associated helicase Cas3' [Thermocrinis sp.]